MIAATLLACLAAAAAITAGWLRPAAVAGSALAALYRLDAPDLDDPARVLRGARHYDRVCARCHGSPERPGQGRHLRLVPPAPTLHLRVAALPPEQLFLVVRDGIPRSAMPAWPVAGREDEVWDMVAFLRALPRLDAAAYRRLAGAPAADPALPPVVRQCAQCHGPTGREAGSDAFPLIGLQTETYLAESLTAFRDRRRASGPMQAAATALTDAEIAAAARHYAAETPPPPTTAPPALVAHGEAARKVAACAACHGPPGTARPAFPRLAGQPARYLERQLHLFAADGPARGGGPFAGLMRQAVGDLSPRDIEAIARWYAGQRGG